MNIVSHRYKFMLTIHPTTEVILEAKWKFEYQLNNTGFTQAQWNSINSGISAVWMDETRRLIKDETERAKKAEEDETNTRKIEDEYTRANWVKYEESGSANRGVYIYQTTEMVEGEQKIRYITK